MKTSPVYRTVLCYRNLKRGEDTGKLGIKTKILKLCLDSREKASAITNRAARVDAEVLET
jgi:hypothetical protein